MQWFTAWQEIGCLCLDLVGAQFENIKSILQVTFASYCGSRLWGIWKTDTVTLNIWVIGQTRKQTYFSFSLFITFLHILFSIFNLSPSIMNYASKIYLWKINFPLLFHYLIQTSAACHIDNLSDLQISLSGINNVLWESDVLVLTNLALVYRKHPINIIMTVLSFFIELFLWSSE